MAIVPRQTNADEEVIAFWKKKRLLTRDEIASLAAGINPFAWQDRLSAHPSHSISAESVQHIKDILVVLDQRLNVTEQSNTILEWIAIFRENEISFPDSLKPPFLKKARESALQLNDPVFIAEMSKILEERKKTKGIPILLKKWFKHDNWTTAEAMYLLVGLDPEGTFTTREETNHGEFFHEIDVAQTLDGIESPPRSMWDTWGVGQDLKEREAYWRYLTELWESGNHHPKNPPTYYIEWAMSKDYEIPWLQWAKDNNLTFTSIGKDSEKPIRTRERTTLLTIIAALLRQEHIDWEQTTKAANIIASATESLGCPVSQRAIEEHLKKIPDAIDRKTKDRAQLRK